MSFATAENQSPKYFSSYLMLVIRYHLKIYCNMLLPYITTFTAQSSLANADHDIHCSTKTKLCAVFRAPTDAQF